MGAMRGISLGQAILCVTCETRAIGMRCITHMITHVSRCVITLHANGGTVMTCALDMLVTHSIRSMV